MNTDPLIERIYEAAVLPDRWPTLMQDIADRLGARAATLNFMGDTPFYISSPGFEPILEEFVAGGWAIANAARLTDLYQEQYPGFRAETAYRTVEELDALPIFRDFLKPRGFNGAAATTIQGVSDTALHVAVEFASHGQAECAVPLLNALRADLARSLSLSAKVIEVKSSAMVQGLNSAGAAAAIVSPDGQLRSVNDRFTRRLGRGMSTNGGRLRFADRFLDSQLAAALAALAAGAGMHSIGVAGTEAQPAVAVHLIPLWRGARDVFGWDGVLLLLAEAANASVPGADLLRLLFDLTPAEARLTRHLVEGRSVAEAARTMGIVETTARVHLRRVFDKTGVRRQAELVRLLLGLGAPG